MDRKRDRNRDAASRGQPIDFAEFFRTQIEEHDDEKEKNHHRPGIYEHLDDADEVGIERHKERGQAEKGNDEAQRAGDGITIKNDPGAEHQH